MRTMMPPEGLLALNIVQGGIIAWAVAHRFSHCGQMVTVPHYLLLFPIVFQRRTNQIIRKLPATLTLHEFLHKRPQTLSYLTLALASHREFTLASVAMASAAGLIERRDADPFPHFVPLIDQMPTLSSDAAASGPRSRRTSGTAELERLVAVATRLSDWFSPLPLPELCYILRARP